MMNTPKGINRIGQATIEFTFAMVMVALLIYGLIQVFRWAGMDYAQRSYWSDHYENPPMDSGFIAFEEAQLNNASEYRQQRLNAFTRRF